MSLLIQVLAFIITVLVLVSVHEAGHFFVAKLFGVKVVKFSIGFGKAFLHYKDKSGTEYAIAWLPLGGYVRLLDEREMKVPNEQKRFAFNRQPLWVRAAIVLAGPLTNFLFAVLAFWLMFMIGVEATRPVIGDVYPNTIASRAGLKGGDEILKVDNSETSDWQKVVLALVKRIGDKNELPLDVQNPTGQKKHYVLNLKEWKLDPLTPDLLKSLGMRAYRPNIPPILNQVMPNSSAEKSGLKKGDKILTIAGQPVKDWYDFVTYIHSHPDQKVLVNFQRGDKNFSTTVHIAKKLDGFQWVGFIGVSPPKFSMPKEMKKLHKYNAGKALKVAVQQTWNFFVFHFVIVKKMLLGQISIGSLGGPIALFETAEMAFLQGVTIFLGYLGLISVMLAFVNMLPIPGLDGGHLLYYLIELIRGKPLSPAVEMLTIRIGIIILLLIMFIGTMNDILRLFSGTSVR